MKGHNPFCGSALDGFPPGLNSQIVSTCRFASAVKSQPCWKEVGVHPHLIGEINEVGLATGLHEGAPRWTEFRDRNEHTRSSRR